MKRQLAILAAMILAPSMLQAAVIYDGATGVLATDLAAFDVTQDLGDGTTYSVDNVPPTTDFGASYGNAIRMYDNSTADKPELQGEFGSALTQQYRIDFKSWNYATAGTTKAIRFRMANTGKSITSESRSAFSISWQADGKVSAKYSDGGLGDGNALDVDTKSSAALFDQDVSVTIVGNNALSGQFSYNYFGVDRDLNAQSYDVYINGALLNSGSDAWYANGMKYTLEYSSADYDPSLGLQRFGLLGSSNSDVGSDVMLDDIILTVIPEPATLGLLGISGAFMLVARRLRRN